MKRLNSFRSRGRLFHYFRWPDGKRTPLVHDVPAEDPRLVGAWAACNAECEKKGKGDEAPRQGSVKQGFTAFMETQQFAGWADVTRKNRAAVYRRLISGQGDRPLVTIATSDVQAALDAKSPAGALADLKALRPAFAWMARIKLIDANPCIGVTPPKLPKSDGYETWTAEDVEAFQARWPVGTTERLVFDLGLYTGQRRADLTTLGRQMVRDGVLTVKQSKTGATAYVPMTPDLRAAVEPFADRMVWLLTSFGKPFTPAGLGNFFRDAASAAGVAKGLHGLRKAFCVYHAERGRSTHEIAAMSGHKRLDEIELYTRAADRRRMVQALSGKHHPDVASASTKASEIND